MTKQHNMRCAAPALLVVAIGVLPGCDYATAPIDLQPSKESRVAEVEVTSKKEISNVSPEQRELRETITKMVEAHGGDKLQTNLRRGRMKMRAFGEFAPGIQGDAIIVEAFDGPTKFRRHVKATIGSEEMEMLFVINGSQGWMTRNGGEPQPLPLPPAPTDNFLGKSFNGLCQMKNATELEKADDVPDTNWDGIWFRLGDAGEGTVYFDPETYLIMSSFKWIPDVTRGELVAVQTYYEDYEQFDGMTLPTLINAYKDGEVWLLTRIEELELNAELDASLFEKPSASK